MHSGSWHAWTPTRLEIASRQNSSRRGNHTAHYRGLRKCKEVRAAAANQAHRKHGRQDLHSTRLPAPKAASPKPFPEKQILGFVWNHAVRGGRVLKDQATSTQSHFIRTRSSKPSSRQPEPAVNVGSSYGADGGITAI
jgi:hypothetical protein